MHCPRHSPLPSLKRGCYGEHLEHNSHTPSDKIPLKVKRSLFRATTSRPSFTISILQQRNTLQQECGFKEMSNVYVVVFVQAGPLHCSLKNHLSVPVPPIRHCT